MGLINKFFGLKIVLFLVGSFFVSNIFSQIDSSYIVNNIEITGNDKTKESVIIRELTFFVGDTILSSNLPIEFRKSKENILNLLLFHTCDISFNKDGYLISIIIKVQERWYLWPNPIFEIADRNFNVWLHEKNWDKVNYGLLLVYNNATGYNDQLKLKFRKGYKEHYSFGYKTPYLNKMQTMHLQLNLNYFRRKEIEYTTLNDKPVLYYNEDEYVWSNLNFELIYRYRPKLYSSHNVLFTGIKYTVHDTISELNANYLGDGAKALSMLSFSYSFAKDFRDSKVYPLSGNYYRITAGKNGIGLINNYINDWNLKASYLHFLPLKGRWVFSTGTLGNIKVHKNLPYIMNTALGYQESIAGYDLYVIDGSNYITSKNSLKYQLLKEKSTTLKKLKNPKFNRIPLSIYLNFIIDGGYVYNPEAIIGKNNLDNTLLYSTGIGVDFVSYYDIVIRTELTLNKFGEPSFFIYWGKPFASW